MNDPMYYYDVIVCNNNGIQSMIRNEYVDANRYLQMALKHIKELVGSIHRDDQQQNINHQNENKITSCTMKSTATATVTATVASNPSQQPSSSLSLSLTDLLINDNTIKYDSISLMNMRITSTNTFNTTVSTASTHNNMSFWNEEMNVLQFRPIQIEMPMEITSTDKVSSSYIISTSTNHGINRLDMLSCIILYNIAICYIYHDMHNKKLLLSSSTPNGANIVHQHCNLIHSDKCYIAYRLLTVATTFLCEILSVSFGSISEQDDSMSLWFGMHQLEYRILYVLIYLIRFNDDVNDDDNNHHHNNMITSSSEIYEQMIQRFHNVQKIIMNRNSVQ